MAWKKNWMKKKHWKVNPGFQPLTLELEIYVDAY